MAALQDVHAQKLTTVKHKHKEEIAHLHEELTELRDKVSDNAGLFVFFCLCEMGGDFCRTKNTNIHTGTINVNPYTNIIQTLVIICESNFQKRPNTLRGI